MNNLYQLLHEFFNSQPRFRFPFDNQTGMIPSNGIYLIFEEGEQYNNLDRIVRVGTHTGKDQLHSRLNQHFNNPNKNRSIFRKNIGRAILNKEKNQYLSIWELDSTSKADKTKNGELINKVFESELEDRISNYIQKNLSFTIFEVTDKTQRLFWESRLISTLAQYPGVNPSKNWLGNFSPKEKIRKYGLWQVNEILRQPLNKEEINQLFEIITSA